MTELPGAVDNAVLGALRESVGGDPEFLGKLVEKFLQDAPKQLESLREAASSGDATTARRAAHTLKGNSLTFGAGALASLCQDAETAASADNLAAVLPRLDEIDDEWSRVGAELVAWCEGLGVNPPASRPTR
jgi:HPt (histidine-containing phosphotransfer) domain-containing protein